MLDNLYGKIARFSVPKARKLELFPDPETLDDLLIADPWGNKLKAWVRNPETMPPALLIHGPAGCGKTSIARVLVNTHGYIEYANYFQLFEAGAEDTKVLYVNVNDTQANTGVDMIKDALDIFHTKTNRMARTLLIVDEAHDLTDRALNILKPAMEMSYEKEGHFSFGGNIILLSTKENIGDKQLMSRLIKVNAGDFDGSKVVKMAFKGLRDNNIEFDTKAVKDLWLQSECPREFFNYLQYSIVWNKDKTSGKLDILS